MMDDSSSEAARGKNNIRTGASGLTPDAKKKRQMESDTYSDTTTARDHDQSKSGNSDKDDIINTQSIRDDLLKIAPYKNKKKKKTKKKKKQTTTTPDVVPEYSIFNLHDTTISIEQELSQLEVYLADNNYAKALSILDGFIDNYPNKQLFNTKLQYAIITLKSQPTPEQLDKSLHMLLRCKWQSQYDNGNGADADESLDKPVAAGADADEPPSLLDKLITKICNQQIQSKHKAEECKIVLNCVTNGKIFLRHMFMFALSYLTYRYLHFINFSFSFTRCGRIN